MNKFHTIMIAAALIISIGTGLTILIQVIRKKPLVEGIILEKFDRDDDEITLAVVALLDNGDVARSEVGIKTPINSGRS